MRVLIAFGRKQFSNPYVDTLADGLERCGVDLTCSSTEFWDNWKAYDVIHIQWPDQLIKERKASSQQLKEILETQKAAGKKIVVTCHNLSANIKVAPDVRESFPIAYSLADAIVHMGPYSRDLYLEMYPNAVNRLIPHHVYDHIYTSALPSREESLKALSLDPGCRYLICFGYFRDHKERRLVYDVYKHFKSQGIKVLAPQYYRRFNYRNPIETLKNFVSCHYSKMRYRGIICKGGFVSDEELQYMYAVSEIAFVQRMSILNSGTIPMAYLMGKVCVGPDVMNVGALIRELGDPVFVADDRKSVYDAVEKALALSKSGKGATNRQYVLDHFATDKIAPLYKDLYESLVK